MKKSSPSLSLLLASLTIAFATSPAIAKNHGTHASKTGEQVYQQACVACHASGVASAPKLGDQKAWAPLIAEGQHILTAHAWVGVRAMPAQGGAPDLSLEEFAKGVAWMVSKSGGDWKVPDTKMMKRIANEAANRLDAEIEAKEKLKDKLENQLRKG